MATRAIGEFVHADEPASPTATTPDDTAVTSQTPTPTSRTLSMGETATSSDGVSVTLSEPRVRKIIYTPDVGSSVHAYPAGNRRSQYLVFSVSAQGANVTSLRFAPVLEGMLYEGQTYRHSFTRGSSGSLSFHVPIVRAQSGMIVWRPSATERYRWELPEPALTALGNSPRFEVEKFSVPGAITRGNPFTARLTVTNTGERDGRFLAVVLDDTSSSIPLVDEFTVPVPRGETVIHDVPGRPVETDRSSITAILDWGIDRQEATFSISR